MATTYELPGFKDPAVFRPQTGDVRRTLTFTPSTWAINDVYKVAGVPLGAKLQQGWYLECADIDSSTGATVTVQVVDGSTTKNIIVAATTPQAGGVVYDSTATVGQQTGWVNYKIATKTAYVAVKAAAAASGTFTAGAFILQFAYSTDLEAAD